LLSIEITVRSAGCPSITIVRCLSSWRPSVATSPIRVGKDIEDHPLAGTARAARLEFEATRCRDAM
jgi:hypothetical protein